MELTSEEIGVLRQYLLGELAPERATPLEERLLRDAAFHDEVSIAEDELIDRYLAGGLAADERALFETHFLAAPERQKKLRFARTLHRYVAARPQTGAAAVAAESLRPDAAAAADERDAAEAAPPSPKPDPGKQGLFKLLFARRPAFAFSTAAALLLVAAVSWQWAVNRPYRHVPRNVHAVVLAPGLTRDAGDSGRGRVQIPRDADTLRLQLTRPAGDHQSYRAVLLTPERVEVSTATDLRPGDGVINFDVPSDRLKPGDYQVRLSGRLPDGGFEDVGRYTFRVLD